MTELKDSWRGCIASAVNTLKKQKNCDGADILAADIVMEKPPKPDMGDLGFPMFPFARLFRMAPPVIASEIVKIIAEHNDTAGMGDVLAEGPYVNVRLAKGAAAAAVLNTILTQNDAFGRTGSLSGRKVMIEFSSPNTNKPLHLGHLRNDALGESVARILKFAGADVKKVCIINNRGVHICKSMLAYKKFFDGETPESRGVKSDRFVGDCYVQFAKWEKEDPNAEVQAQEMLRKWEAGDPETVVLWKQMNEWAINGMRRTYERTGVSFDTYYYESETYLSGKDEIQKGLQKGIFYKDEEGTTWIDLTAEGLDKKVLLRKDGTSVYITQDIGTAIARHNDWPFDQLVYVVGSEQVYHFKVLFLVLKKLGFTWADMLYHLSYGMVNLPEGRMKSREGTVVDADDLINQLQDLAREEIKSKDREAAVGNVDDVSEKIALAALHYFLLQVTPTKDMLFNPKESLSFNGNTGPYLQYMGARISSILRKSAETGLTGSVRYDMLTEDAEWELLKLLGDYPVFVDKAASSMDPSQLAVYLYEVCKSFSKFYHDCPILAAADADLAATRMELVKAVLIVLKSAMNLILVPFVESM